MFSANKKKCPICGVEYVKNQGECAYCNWDLTLYSGNQKISSAQILKKNEDWARIACYRANNYRKERNELRKKMEESQNLVNELLELKIRLSELEKQVDDLSNQDSRSSNLKQEILADLYSRIKKIVRESLKDLSIQTQSTSMETFNSINLGDTKFTENNPNSENTNSPHITPYQELDHYEQYVIEQYYNNPNFLANYAYKVTPTKKTLEDIYLNKANEIIFQDSNQSDYWIVKLETGGYYLLPDLNLKINTNLKTVKTIFELRGYQEHLSKNFQVIKPAKVFEVNQNQWRLSDKGILNFNY